MAEETTTAVIKVEEVQQILVPIPEMYAQGQNSLKRATEATQALLDTIEAEGMSAALDAEALKIIKALKITKDKLNERRKPVTQFIQSVTKLFTALESSIEVLTEIVQKQRDEYAKAVAAEQRKAQELAAKQIAKEKEAAAIEADVKIKLQAYMQDYLQKELLKLNNLFESATLDTIDETAKKVITYPADYPLKHYQAFKYTPVAFHHVQGEADLIAQKAIKEGGYPSFAVEFRQAITDQVAKLADRIASKRNELEAMKAAENDAAEKARLEKIAADRKAEEQARIAAEAAKAKAEAEAAAKAAEMQANTQTLFDAQEAIADVPQQVSQVRTGYEIEVKRPAGYMQIANFYFEKEGLSVLDMEKLGRKTLAQMKSFCEAYALKTGEVIQSPYLVYHETFKAVNR